MTKARKQTMYETYKCYKNELTKASFENASIGQDYILNRNQYSIERNVKMN